MIKLDLQHFASATASWSVTINKSKYSGVATVTALGNVTGISSYTITTSGFEIESVTYSGTTITISIARTTSTITASVRGTVTYTYGGSTSFTVTRKRNYGGSTYNYDTQSSTSTYYGADHVPPAPSGYTYSYCSPTSLSSDGTIIYYYVASTYTVTRKRNYGGSTVTYDTDTFTGTYYGSSHVPPAPSGYTYSYCSPTSLSSSGTITYYYTAIAYYDITAYKYWGSTSGTYIESETLGSAQQGTRVYASSYSPSTPSGYTSTGRAVTPTSLTVSSGSNIFYYTYKKLGSASASSQDVEYNSLYTAYYFAQYRLSLTGDGTKTYTVAGTSYSDTSYFDNTYPLGPGSFAISCSVTAGTYYTAASSGNATIIIRPIVNITSSSVTVAKGDSVTPSSFGAYSTPSGGTLQISKDNSSWGSSVSFSSGGTYTVYLRTQYNSIYSNVKTATVVVQSTYTVTSKAYDDYTGALLTTTSATVAAGTYYYSQFQPTVSGYTVSSPSPTSTVTISSNQTITYYFHLDHTARDITAYNYYGTKTLVSDTSTAKAKILDTLYGSNPGSVYWESFTTNPVTKLDWSVYMNSTSSSGTATVTTPYPIIGIDAQTITTSGFEISNVTYSGTTITIYINRTTSSSSVTVRGTVTYIRSGSTSITGAGTMGGKYTVRAIPSGASSSQGYEGAWNYIVTLEGVEWYTYISSIECIQGTACSDYDSSFDVARASTGTSITSTKTWYSSNGQVVTTFDSTGTYTIKCETIYGDASMAVAVTTATPTYTVTRTAKKLDTSVTMSLPDAVVDQGTTYYGYNTAPTISGYTFYQSVPASLSSAGSMVYEFGRNIQLTTRSEVKTTVLPTDNISTWLTTYFVVVYSDTSGHVQSNVYDLALYTSDGTLISQSTFEGLSSGSYQVRASLTAGMSERYSLKTSTYDVNLSIVRIFIGPSNIKEGEFNGKAITHIYYGDLLLYEK